MTSLLKWVPFKQRPGAQSLFFVSAGFLFLILCVPTHYETRDDISFFWNLNGGDGYPADAFIPYTGQILNSVMLFLYAHASVIPWWGLLLFFSAYLFTVLSTALLLRIGSEARLLLPALLYFLFHAVAFLSITNATLLLEVGALLCLYEIALTGKIPTQHPLLYGVVVGSALTLSLLMRWEIALYFLTLGLIPLFFLSAPSALRKWIPLVLIALACLVGDRLVYQKKLGPAEKEFIAYNVLRAKFQDTPAGEFHPGVTEKALRQTGWTVSDDRFFQNWLVYDPVLFNANKLRTFLEANTVRQTTSELLSAARRIGSNFFSAKKNCLMLVCALFILAVANFTRYLRTHRRTRLLALIPLAANVAAIFFFLNYRFVPRVYLPLFLFTLIGALLVFRYCLSSPTPREKSVAGNFPLQILFGLELIGALIFTAAIAKELHQDSLERKFVAACLQAAAAAQVKTVVNLDPGPGVPLETFSPLHENILPVGLKYFPDGGAVNTPRNLRILSSLGLSGGRDFLWWLIGNKDVGLVIHNRDLNHIQEMLQEWESYYRRNLSGPTVRLTPFLTFPDPQGGALRFYRMEIEKKIPSADKPLRVSLGAEPNISRSGQLGKALE